MSVVCGKNKSFFHVPLFYFQFIESFSIDTYYITLRNKGFGVDTVNEAEYFYTFTSFSQNNQYLSRFLAVPAFPVKNGDSSVELFAYGFRYLVIFVGKNKKLYGLACTVHIIVQHNHGNDEYAKSEYYFLRFVKYKIAGRYDGNIAKHKCAS